MDLANTTQALKEHQLRRRHHHPGESVPEIVRLKLIFIRHAMRLKLIFISALAPAHGQGLGQGLRLRVAHRTTMTRLSSRATGTACMSTSNMATSVRAQSRLLLLLVRTTPMRPSISRARSTRGAGWARPGMVPPRTGR